RGRNVTGVQTCALPIFRRSPLGCEGVCSAGEDGGGGAIRGVAVLGACCGGRCTVGVQDAEMVRWTSASSGSSWPVRRARSCGERSEERRVGRGGVAGRA